MSFLEGIDRAAFDETLRNARQRLLDERNGHGWWTGELSSSALSTATAIVAMSLAQEHGCAAARGVDPLIHAGARWLIDKQNDDGGWGDTDKSFSNISTTMLCWGALGLVGHEDTKARSEGEGQTEMGATGGLPASDIAAALKRCEQWLANHAGSLEVPALVESVMKRYGKDRTFSVPILTMCALSGRLGPPAARDTWKWVRQLPFELAALPRWFFNKLNLQVVSYALPALIAIGRVRHHFRPTRNPLARLLRAFTKKRTLALLQRIQPGNGGFLEATPLTSFVTMSLAACGLAQHAVTRKGVEFIKASARHDGSWAIDTNLATWVTTLSVNALAAGGPRKLHEYLDEHERRAIRDWLLGQQYKEVHPYTGAAPGGWAWTDLPGGVPDADDTSGAVLALDALAGDSNADSNKTSIDDGVTWLLGLQNRDGGIPTFCRGWGRLPFDQSCPDITAHAIRATSNSIGDMPRHVFFEHLLRMCKHLLFRNGSKHVWTPLWFGNQHCFEDTNAVYGTSRVLLGLVELAERFVINWLNLHESTCWLLDVQNDDGGWGGGTGAPSSLEESALALDALGSVCNPNERMDTRGFDVAAPRAAVARGVGWLIEHTRHGTDFPPAPIGFYFAKLWYYEKLYPIIFTVAALERVGVLLEEEEEGQGGTDLE